MSDEVPERDVEALAAFISETWFGYSDGPYMNHGAMARTLLASDWYAERIKEARRDGAAEADAVLREYLRLGPVDALRAALRGDA